MTNKETTLKTIAFVLEFEKAQGREPLDVSSDKRHRGYDVKSDHRMIEVKGATESY